MAASNEGLPILFAEDQRRLNTIAGVLKGSEVSRITYAIPAEGPWPSGRAQNNVHEIDDGVELLTPGDGVVVRWAMSGRVEGLSVELLSEASYHPDHALIRRLDVSEFTQWQPFLGRPLFLRGIATHVPDGTDRATIWSLRFESSGEAKVVIALGEWTRAGPEYLPDTLVAIFDEAIARSFRIPDNPISAWGVDWRVDGA